MKVRFDFVTNSSSSSFIIEKSQLSYGQLLKYLLQIANKEAEYYDDYSGGKKEKAYSWKDVSKDRVAGRYVIRETSEENPYEYCDDDDNDKKYDSHYIIDNETCGRYDWDIISEILGKHHIAWEMGYCD